MFTFTSVGILLFLLSQFAIAFFVGKNIRSEKDYFLAGRSLNLPLAMFSIFATWFGAETCIGSAAAISASGLYGGRADPFGYTICLILMAIFLANALYKRNLTTLADLYEQVFSANVAKLAVLIIVPSSLIWAAAQLRGLGQVLSVATTLDVRTALTLGTLVVIAYTYIGGLMGDVIADFIHGIIMIIGLVYLLWSTFAALGGIGPAFGSIPIERLSLIDPEETWLAALDSWAIPILGSLVAQELISRVIASKSAKVATQASFAGAGLYLAVGSIPVLLGLFGANLITNLEHQDEFLPRLAQQLLSPIGFVIFTSALISAILSTIDSTLLTISALITHNFIIPLTGRPWSDAERVRLARIFVVVGGVSAFLLAAGAESIYSLVEAASSFGTSGILVITLFGLFSRWQDPLAATSALLVGLVAKPLAEYGLGLEAPFLFAIATSALTFVGIARYRQIGWLGED